MKKLLVISNHNPANWSEEQKYGWDDILYHPFPEVNPDMSRIDIINEIIPPLRDVINKFIYHCFVHHTIPYVNLQGEYTVCLILYTMFNDKVTFVFPTTAREVKEVKMEDGSIRKEAIFRFVRWR